jgi:hypothetical protein
MGNSGYWTTVVKITDPQTKHLPRKKKKKKRYYDVKWTNTKSFQLHELKTSPIIEISFDTRIVMNAKWKNNFKTTLYK